MLLKKPLLCFLLAAQAPSSFVLANDQHIPTNRFLQCPGNATTTKRSGPRGGAVERFLATESIRETLGIFPLAIDNKDLDALSLVVMEDAVVHFPAPIGDIEGISALKQFITKAQGSFDSLFHAVSTQMIQICSADSAVSLSYVTSTQAIGQSATSNLSKFAIANGVWKDTWTKADGGWRIVERTVQFVVCFPGA